MAEVFAAEEERPETEAICEEKSRKGEQDFRCDPAIHEQDRLKELAAEKISRCLGLATCACCEKTFVRVKNGIRSSVYHSGKLRPCT